MEPASTDSNSAYKLCVQGKGFRLKNPDTTLTLSDDGISYELDGRSGLRPFAQLRSVRLQSVSPGRNHPFESTLELIFERGLPLTVLSNSPYGTDDKKRDRHFVAFVEDLHRRLSLREHSHIRFLFGVPESQSRLTPVSLTVLLLVVGVVSTPVVAPLLRRGGSAFDILAALIGLVAIGWFILRSRERNRPGVYDPRHPPRHLYPE